MYTTLRKIAEYGSTGDTKRVKMYMELFIQNHGREKTYYNDPIEVRLAKDFKDILDGKETSQVTLD